jgi:very-short-patch-repair endonuclease
MQLIGEKTVLRVLSFERDVFRKYVLKAACLSLLKFWCKGVLKQMKSFLQEIIININVGFK